jgi:endoglucanase
VIRRRDVPADHAAHQRLAPPVAQPDRGGLRRDLPDGIARATGFYTNVSNFYPVQRESDYAGKVSSRVGWKHYVIDVSRNGRGWTGTWCNPSGAGLGQDPRSVPGSTKLDALLWVKHPGASDGPCNGGPAAGAWWEEYALALVANRPS